MHEGGKKNPTVDRFFLKGKSARSPGHSPPCSNPRSAPPPRRGVFCCGPLGRAVCEFLTGWMKSSV